MVIFCRARLIGDVSETPRRFRLVAPFPRQQGLTSPRWHPSSGVCTTVWAHTPDLRGPGAIDLSLASRRAGGVKGGAAAERQRGHP